MVKPTHSLFIECLFVVSSAPDTKEPQQSKNDSETSNTTDYTTDDGTDVCNTLDLESQSAETPLTGTTT